MIKSVRVKNFRSLLDVHVELALVTVLIGKSGTGKTNFVAALRSLRAILAGQQPDRWQPAQGGTDDGLQYEVVFSVPQIQGEYRYEVTRRLKNGTPRISSEALWFSGQCLFSHEDRSWKQMPAMSVVPNIEGVMLNRLSSIPEVLIASLSLMQGLGCYDFPGNVFQYHAQEREPKITGLWDDGANYLQVADSIVSNLQDLLSWKEINSAMRRLDESIQGVTLQLPERNNVFVSYKLADKSLAIELASQSEGFRRFFAHLLAIYQQPAKQVLVFEEPEKGIYPGALAVLADYFTSAAATNRGQIIMTTHSPQLLDHFEPDSIRVVTKDNLATRIAPLASEQVDALRKDLIRPGELLTVTSPMPAVAGES